MRIFVGGLPQHPEPPLNYQIVYSLEGVLDYYTTLSWVVRDGKRTQVKALSEREPVEFPKPVGSSRRSTRPADCRRWRSATRARSRRWSTRRSAIRGTRTSWKRSATLGLLDLAPVDVKGVKVVPRDVFVATMGPRLTKPKGRDLVALRVIVEGKKGGKRRRRSFELVDRYDEAHGISAMMRTTGYSLSITGLMQAQGEIKPAGVHTPDECMPGAKYIDELAKRGVNIREIAF